MGNEASTMNQNANSGGVMGSTRKLQSGSPKSSGRVKKGMRKTKSLDSATRPLEEHDLDEIYAFIQHMKKTNMGTELLGEFLDKQARKMEDGDEKIKDQWDFPIHTINIARDEPAPTSSKRQRTPPCA